MPEYKGVEYLRKKLNLKRNRVKLRYDFYEMKNDARDFGISTPPRLRNWFSSLGWCARAVDSIADRLVFREFADDAFDMNGIFRMNNADILPDSAFLSALIGACSFIYISADENGFPRLQVIDGANATGIIDPVTYLLKEGYAVLERDDRGNALLEAHFQTGRTWFYDKRDGSRPRYSIKNTAPYPLLVPVIFRPDAHRYFGHSRISRACMSYAESAIRTIKRGEISAEFYSFPQKYVTGLSQDAEEMDKWTATMSSFLRFTLNEDEENKVQLGSFPQQSMQPHIDQLRMFASLFAGETGLTLDDLGFVSDNPSSAEAIKASHENLRLTARKAQRTFGTGLLNAGYLAACIRDEYPYLRNQIDTTTVVWDPIFEPDAASLSGIGDAVGKIQQAFPNYFTEDKLRNLTGI